MVDSSFAASTISSVGFSGLFGVFDLGVVDFVGGVLVGVVLVGDTLGVPLCCTLKLFPRVDCLVLVVMIVSYKKNYSCC